MEGSSAFQFGRAAYKAGLLSRRQLLADAWANLRFRLRGATDETSHALRDRISASLAGARVRDLQRLGPDVLARILPRIYPRMLALAYEHQDAGRPVYIATAASEELASVLARVLALDGGIGSQMSEVRDGVFTGQPTGLFIYGADKARAIEQLAERQGIDLAASYAYSDSASDLPMLRAVGLGQLAVSTPTGSVSVPANSRGTVSASCPSGTVVLAGGGGFPGVTTRFGLLQSSNASGNSWLVEGWNLTTTAQTLTVRAVCIAQ